MNINGELSEDEFMVEMDAIDRRCGVGRYRTFTPQMIEAGVTALARRCPFDVAFPVGGAEEAVREVLLAALSAERP